MSDRKSSGTEPDPLVLRADAGPDTGTGHVMRCLTLGEAWVHHGGRARLVSARLPGQLQERAEATGLEVERVDVDPGSPSSADRIASTADDLGASWVVEDGYHFGPEHQRRLRDLGPSVLWIDDLGRSVPIPADVVVNQNLHASPHLYPEKDPRTELLLGPRYALVRREFREREIRKDLEIPDRAGTLLVTLGGTDTTCYTFDVLDALDSLEEPSLTVKVILGAQFPDVEGAERRVRSLDCEVEILHDVRDMASLMATSDAAFAAAGSTIWELLHMGVPCATVAIADNQRPVLEALERRDAVLSVGWHEEAHPARVKERLRRLIVDETLRSRLAAQGPKVVDGRGVERIVDRLKEGHDAA